MAFQRIVADHQVMAGVPGIRGTRIPVATVIGLVAEGMTTGEILTDFPSSPPMTYAERSSSPPLLSIRPRCRCPPQREIPVVG